MTPENGNINIQRLMISECKNRHDITEILLNVALSTINHTGMQEE